MNRFFASTALLLLAVTACAPTAKQPPTAPAAPAVTHPIVGGAAMDPARTIMDNLRLSAEHRTLVAALDAAGLSNALAHAGSFTLFAPTDAAFARLPPGTVEALMHPRSRSELAGLLNYHLLTDARDRASIAANIAAAGGRAVSYRTAAGTTIMARMEGDRLILSDANGRRAAVTQADITQANGIFHVVDTVLLPPM
jgi:uncharacterized surface protein with fasciclin (FAS1) repeats